MKIENTEEIETKSPPGCEDASISAEDQIIVNYVQRQKSLLIETSLERASFSFTTFQAFDKRITSSRLSSKTHARG